MDECIHRIDLCPDCDGLRVVTLNRIPGIANIRFEAGPRSFSGPVIMYAGPADEPCPHLGPRREGTGG